MHESKRDHQPHAAVDGEHVPHQDVAYWRRAHRDKPGIDKAYGIRKLRDLLGISLEEMIYVGDALFVGGNDYPAEEAGVVSISVRGPNETKCVTEAIIACLDGHQPARPCEEI